jgi:hypothetical protein
MLYIGFIIALLAAGVVISWSAVSRPAHTVALEHVSGALLIAGLSLLGFALPIVHRFTSN